MPTPPEPDDDGGEDDIIEVDDEEFNSWPDEVKALCEVVPENVPDVTPRMEKRRRWHEGLLAEVKKRGFWFPGDE